jgi:hypothetical protein
MRRTKWVVMCLSTALAGCAVGAASASAEAPEYGRCAATAKGTGKFSSATCTIEKAGGSYEWSPGAGLKNHFTSKMKEATLATLETVKKEKVVCKTETSTAEFTGVKTIGGVVATFTGCEALKLKCNSAGQPEGTIVTFPLKGVLGVEKKGETKVKDKLANELTPENGNDVFAEFSCGGFVVIVRGHVLSPVPSNKMLLVTTVKFTASKGKQKPERFEGGPLAILESSFSGGAYEQSGQTLTTIETGEEKMEANSVF